MQRCDLLISPEIQALSLKTLYSIEVDGAEMSRCFNFVTENMLLSLSSYNHILASKISCKCLASTLIKRGFMSNNVRKFTDFI